MPREITRGTDNPSTSVGDNSIQRQHGGMRCQATSTSKGLVRRGLAPARCTGISDTSEGLRVCRLLPRSLLMNARSVSLPCANFFASTRVIISLVDRQTADQASDSVESIIPRVCHASQSTARDFWQQRMSFPIPSKVALQQLPKDRRCFRRSIILFWLPTTCCPSSRIRKTHESVSSVGYDLVE